MNGTSIGNFLNEICSDCGGKGCSFKHWGRLVPKGKLGSFCFFCLEQRQKLVREGKAPLPLGVQPPGIPEEFTNCSLRVITKDKTIYCCLGPTMEEDELIIASQNKKSLPYIRVRVMQLEIGKEFVFRVHGDKNCGLFYTTSVVSIEPRQIFK